ISKLDDTSWSILADWILLINYFNESTDDPATQSNVSRKWPLALDSSSIPSDSHKWIHQWVPNAELRNDLISIKNQIEASRQDLSTPIKYYTDGSLKKYYINDTLNDDISTRTNINMGAGFVVEHLTDQFTLGTHAYVSDWPRSEERR